MIIIFSKIKKGIKMFILKEKKLMMSLHLKATMMKISDPVLFGHCVQVYYKVKPGFTHSFGPFPVQKQALPCAFTSCIQPE
jgi:monomeric isocitrate dehydrogenase